jgi:hypothetical protein
MMKKLMTLLLVICMGALYTNVSGQQTQTKKNEKKGGFAVGGYDQTKSPAKPAKRGIDIPEEAADVPAPVMEAKEAKEDKGNAYGQDKQGPGGKEFGQAKSQSAKEKQKAKKNTKSKGNRR